MEARKLIVGMLLIGVAAVPFVANAATIKADAPVVGNGPLTPEIIVEMLGYVPESVQMISYEPEPVERTVSWEDLKTMLSISSIGGTPDAPGGCIPVCPVDTGYGIVGSGWYCDNSSVWVSYGKTMPAGSSYLTATDNGPAGITTCYGFYGPTRNWDITMSVIPGVLAPGSYDGCYATVWNIGADGYCQNSFTPRDTFNLVQISGAGVKTTLNFGSQWFDYFLGNGADLSRM